MAVAINIFIFATPNTLSADECADCSNTLTSDFSTTFNYGECSFYIDYDFSGQAELMLTDEKGSTVIKKLEACIGKPCSITISADGLNTGVYVYALLLDGKIIKSQKMMLIK